MSINVNVIVVPTSKIKANAWNPNEQTDFIFEKEVASIKKFGFLDPLLVREIKGKYEIIDGEHRYRAACEIGFDELPVNNLGKVPDAVAKQLTIIMNETRGEARRDKLASLMQDLHNTVDHEALYAALPYTQNEITALVESLSVDWDSVTNPVSIKPKPSVSPPETQPEGSNEALLSFVVPAEMKDQFFAQLSRINQAIHPEKDPLACHAKDAIQLILDILESVDLEDFLDKK